MTTISERLGCIPPDYYHRSEVLDLELDAIFAASWLCVGFTEQLANHNDFVTAEIERRSIVVQNFRGSLRAFRNVCSHRFSRLQCDRSGNRGLTCPYHGWSYDAHGVPVGIPYNRESFGFDTEQREALRLESYSVETCGRFVFVRMAPSGLSLREFLGGCYAALLHLSEICTDRFESLSLEWDANWKTGMDNAAEGYHVPLVHPESFGQVLSLDLRIETDGEHTIYRGDLTPRSRKWWDTVAKGSALQPSPLYPEYANFLIFPNIVITLSYGAFMTFQTIEPIDAGRLRINSTAWLAANRGGGVRDIVVEQLKAFSHTVREEDRIICGKAQLGLRQCGSTRPALLGALEGRILNFQRAYARRMGIGGAG